VLYFVSIDFQAEKSNKRHRPIGIGVQGLADTLLMMRYAFEGDEAQQLNRDIFETIYYSALKTSCELARLHGPYQTYEGSPVSRGVSVLMFSDLLRDIAVCVMCITTMCSSHAKTDAPAGSGPPSLK